MRNIVASMLLSVLLLPATAAAKRCEINGEEVNPDNGSTTAGKTGILTCWHDDGKKMYEHELRDGKHLGLDRSYGFDGSVSERRVNELGNTEGVAREFYPDGTLKSEGTYNDADAVGLTKNFHKNGKIAALRFYPSAGEQPVATIEYDDQGRLRNFSCAPQSAIPEDKVLCGYGGQAVETELYDQRGGLAEKRTMKEGKLVRVDGYNDAGTVVESVETTPKGRIERRFFDNGQKAAETVVEGDWKVAQSEWYMNGAIKAKSVLEPAERDPRVVNERYRDTGVLQEREELRGRDRVRVEHFDEQGKRSEEFVYAEEGHVKLHRKFSADGQVSLEEEMYPDGSRKVIKGQAD